MGFAPKSPVAAAAKLSKLLFSLLLLHPPSSSSIATAAVLPLPLPLPPLLLSYFYYDDDHFCSFLQLLQTLISSRRDD